MIRLLTTAICVLIFLTSPARAQDRSYIGRAHFVNNDLFGDTHDRWRSGSVVGSHIFGPAWQGKAPAGFGELVELRISGEGIAPENLAGPVPGDRPYAGVLSFGLHTHFQPRAIEYAVGADIVMTGPMTQIDEIQDGLHDIFGGPGVSQRVRGAQIGNDVNPTLVLEAGREFALGGSAQLRPFVEARAGVETMLRAGADLSFGRAGLGGLMVRDSVTGHRYRTIEQPFAGFSWVMGADIAKVSDSELISSERGVKLTDARARVRAGLHWQSDKGSSVFYGLTWLDQEFTAQREEQIVGSVRLNLKF